MIILCIIVVIIIIGQVPRLPAGRPAEAAPEAAPDTIRSVFKMSCLFLRPRPWQFEI